MEEALIERVLPHSVEAEQSVIGSMIMDRDAIMTASEVITSEDFYQSQYGVLFDAMLELYNEGKPVDLVTLQERLREKDVPPEISSLEFVRDLLDAVPTSANVRHYATIVQEKSMLRKLIKVNEDIANTCYLAREKTEDILEETEKKIFDLLQYRSTGDFVPIKQVVLNALDKIEKASKNKGTVTGIPTGFIDLDYKTSGFQPSDLILIAARPSMGKTAFVLNVAQHMAFKEGKTVAIFSLEMSKEQLVNRLFSLESKVDSQALRTGNLTDEDWAKLIEGAAVVGKSNLIIDDTPGISIAELRSKCRKFKLEHDLGIIIIDYLQLMSGRQTFRVPPAGDLRDFPILKSRGPRTQRTCSCPVPALPSRRAASRPPSDVVRPPRIRSYRAGCRRGYVPLPRRLLQQRHRQEKHRRSHHRQTAKRPYRNR